jgi:hypothetical protein
MYVHFQKTRGISPQIAANRHDLLVLANIMLCVDFKKKFGVDECQDFGGSTSGILAGAGISSCDCLKRRARIHCDNQALPNYFFLRIVQHSPQDLLDTTRGNSTMAKKRTRKGM